MSVAEKIVEHVKVLPESVQTQVLEFVEFLEAKNLKDDADWSRLSLDSAMRGLEGESSPYSEADLKEVFS
ncbi:MAG: DUF2281 domain-containing protein [Verrucomicrobia bacterium]|nr:DUF2281 domain-containing protein [Verrucomicrobiota bacterium]